MVLGSVSSLPVLFFRVIQVRVLLSEVQRVCFVGSTNEDCHPHPLCNLQKLHAVPLLAIP